MWCRPIRNGLLRLRGLSFLFKNRLLDEIHERHDSPTSFLTDAPYSLNRNPHSHPTVRGTPFGRNLTGTFNSLLCLCLLICGYPRLRLLNFSIRIVLCVFSSLLL